MATRLKQRYIKLLKNRRRTKSNS